MTSIKEQSKIRRNLAMLLVTLAVLSLSACGGARKISTKDNSTDYKSARALPPLKKPTPVVASSPSQSPAVQAPVVQTPVVQTPVVQTPVVQTSVVQTSVVQTPVEPAIKDLNISANIVESKQGEARLELAADFDQAWEYLSANLQKSDLTVFSRNKAAGRFSIGCADIAAAPTTVKSGRWSFFNRDKKETLEYCALQAVERRGVTSVSVLNRAGEEVAGEHSNTVFKRILNN